MQQMRLQRLVNTAVALLVAMVAPKTGSAAEFEMPRWADEAEILENQTGLKTNFDGNGYADLAVGAPGQDLNPLIESVGALSAFCWDSSTWMPSSGETWFQTATGSTTSEADDQFAEVLTTGDFNGDGVWDLAIGVPHEDWNGDTHPDAGMVQVLFGASGTGLTLAGSQFFDQGSSGIPGDVEDGDRFGFALAAGDFDDDGYDDLAIGVPYEDIGGIIDAGYVTIIFGGAGGLDVDHTEAWTRNDASGTNENETDDRFGWALATGDFDGDGYGDLAIGTPSDDLGAVTNSGSVDILFGSIGGLTTRPTNDYWHQDRIGIEGTAEPYDAFGATLAAGDFDDDGYDDLAIGVPGEDLGSPAVSNAGYVHVLFGSSAGLTATGSEAFHQGGGSTSDSCELEDQFGLSLATGDFNDDGYDDLVVGVPKEDWGAVPDAGIIHIFWGGFAGVDDHDQCIAQEDLVQNGDTEDHDEFGHAVAASDFNGDGYDDIAVGVPMKDINMIEDAGWVVILFGTSGNVSHFNMTVHQGSAGSTATYEANDRFGWALAAVPLQSVPESLVFADGFESGTTAAWTDTAP
ncbi:MAG: FG-GAP repeat protein [Thermoanaerobaculales bacterium]|jgi:hypothetical protein|nr:FG-GAP repeat protein [Thermoanaerobaculales bacterium]